MESQPVLALAGTDSRTCSASAPNSLDYLASLMSQNGENKKGCHHLHQDSPTIKIQTSGRTVVIDKREKPKDMSLTAYAAKCLGLSHEAAAKALKRALANGNSQ